MMNVCESFLEEVPLGLENGRPIRPGILITLEHGCIPALQLRKDGLLVRLDMLNCSDVLSISMRELTPQLQFDQLYLCLLSVKISPGLLHGPLIAIKQWDVHERDICSSCEAFIQLIVPSSTGQHQIWYLLPPFTFEGYFVRA